jgi:hypothetical protein
VKDFPVHLDGGVDPGIRILSDQETISLVRRSLRAVALPQASLENA